MLHHPLFQPSQSFWTAATFLPVTLTLFATNPGRLHAQSSPATSSSLASAAPTSTNCSDLLNTPCAPPPTLPGTPVRPHVETSISLGAFAQLTPTRIQTSLSGFQTFTQTQGIAPTAGVLGTVRQQFRPWLGYSVNMGYTRVDERYTLPTAFPGGNDLHIPSNLYELSLSYVAEKHLTPQLTGFASIGGGAIIALPINRSPTPVSSSLAYIYPPVNFRPEGTTGFGLDLRLAQHLAFRAEYRGLLYKNPDFGGLQKSTTWTSEPTLSLVYRFGHSRPGVPSTPSTHP